MVDLLKQLPPFEWRGIKYPVSSRSATFQQNQVEHELGRRNQDLIEQTGAKNIRFTYTIPMRNELFRGPYSELFTQGLRQLFIDFRNRTPGIILDPLYGSYRVVPVSWSDDTDVTKRDGTDVRLEFLQAPEDEAPEEEDPPTIQSVEKESAALATDIAEIDASVPDDELDAQLNLRGLLDSASGRFNFPFGVAQQVLGLFNRSKSELERIEYQAREVEKQVVNIASPEAWAIQIDTRELRDRARRAEENRSQIKPVLTRTVTESQSVTSLAAALGVSTQELLEANPSLSERPSVPVGKIVIIPD